MQYIHPDPDASLGKWYMKGTEAGGAFIIIGQDLLREAHTINYVEGYATGASYYRDMGEPVVVCFSAGNLSKVAPEISVMFPKAKHVFIADNDESGTGEREAKKAAEFVQQAGSQAEVRMPIETGDYNDHSVEGELMPELQTTQELQTYDWGRNSTGKMLMTKDNVRGLLTVNLDGDGGRSSLCCCGGELCGRGIELSSLALGLLIHLREQGEAVALASLPHGVFLALHGLVYDEVGGGYPER